MKTQLKNEKAAEKKALIEFANPLLHLSIPEVKNVQLKYYGDG